MKPEKTFIFIVFVLILITCSLAACSWDSGGGAAGNDSRSATPQPPGLQAYDQTATFGANQFHVQLTAIAGVHLVGESAANP